MKWLVLLALACSGCLQKGLFECATSTDCDRNGEQGVCQSQGFCSFADGNCESGQRFSDLSGSLSNQCVDADQPPPPPPPGMFSIGGTISGLTGSVTLEKNGGDALTRTSDGMFTFAGALPDGGDYVISVATQPASQTCVVSNGIGTVAAANVTSIEVACGTLSTDVTLLCASNVECDLAAGEFCCFDPAAGGGVCQTANQCADKRVECDSDNDCPGANVCCAQYMNGGAFKVANCQTQAFCVNVGSVTVEVWCDPAETMPCPTGKTCTGSPGVSNPGWHTCQ